MQGSCNHKDKRIHCGDSLKLCSFCCYCSSLYPGIPLRFKSAGNITLNLMKGFCIASPVSRWKVTVAL